MQNLKALSYKLRQNVVDMIMAGKAGHIGGDMSVMETMVALYFHAMNISPENQDDPNRDMFVMSKGHCVETLYAVLAEKGFFPIEQVIREYSQFGSKFIGHPNNKLPGIEMNSGSLGHGLPVAVGMALAQKMDKRPSRTYVVMGDGEAARGGGHGAGPEDGQAPQPHLRGDGRRRAGRGLRVGGRDERHPV